MRGRKKMVGVALKLIIGLLALAGVLYEWKDLGLPALRLFSFWILLLSAIYYLTVAIKALVYKQHHDGKEIFSSVFEGALLISAVLMCAGFLMIRVTNNFACTLGNEVVVRSGESGTPLAYCTQWAGPGSPYVVEGKVTSLNFVWPLLIYLLIPVLILADWVLFAKKGRWRFVDPLYWLAIPIIYVAMIFLTANSARDWTFPYQFLDYGTVGVRETALWICFAGAMIFFVGYVLLVIDYAASGKLGEHIVLPHIRTVVVEEETDMNVRQNKPEDTSARRRTRNSDEGQKIAPPRIKSAKEKVPVRQDVPPKTEVELKKTTKAQPKNKPSGSGQKTVSQTENKTKDSAKMEQKNRQNPAATKTESTKAPKKTKATAGADAEKVTVSTKAKPQKTASKDEFAIPKVIKRQQSDKAEQIPKIARSPKIEKFATFRMPEKVNEQKDKKTKKSDSGQNGEKSQKVEKKVEKSIKTEPKKSKDSEKGE